MPKGKVVYMCVGALMIIVAVRGKKNSSTSTTTNLLSNFLRQTHLLAIVSHASISNPFSIPAFSLSSASCSKAS